MTGLCQLPIVFISILELAVMCCAGLILFRRAGLSLAEAFSYAIITTLMSISFVYQLSILSGLPWITFLLELIWLPLSLWIVIRFRSDAAKVTGALTRFWRDHPICVSIYALGVLYLVLLALFIPPDPIDWKTLGQIAILREGGILSTVAGGNAAVPLIPLNHAVLPLMFIRAHTDMGVNLFGTMAYVSIACSTYALARRYAWPPTAITAALVVLGMPRLVYHAASPGFEIVPVAAALFCVLALFRSVERLHATDVILLFAGAGFAVADGKAGMLFPAIILALSWLLLIRRHGGVALWALVRDNRWRVTAALAPLLIFSQVWLVWINVRAGGQWVGSRFDGGVQFNNDGLQGAVGNMARYVLESVHLTFPLEHFSRKILDFSMILFLEDIQAALPRAIGGVSGTTEPFAINWAANGHCSWFGPLAFLLIFSALAYAAVRGPRRLKAFAVAVWAYFYLVILIFAWSPGNAHLFSLFFVCGGFTIAFLLPPWRFSIHAKHAVWTVSAVLFFYALLFNTAKPLFPIVGMTRDASRLPCGVTQSEPERPGRKKPSTVWSETRWGFDRNALARRHFGDNRVDEFASIVEKESKVVFATSSVAGVYPFFNASPSIRPTIVPPPSGDGSNIYGNIDADYLVGLGISPENVGPDCQILKIWQSEGSGAAGKIAVLMKFKTVK